MVTYSDYEKGSTLMRSRVRRSAGDGFALVEMLVVIVILGILAAIVVFSVNGVQDKGSTAACQADVKTVTVAAEAYNAKVGHYATSMDELVREGLLHSVPASTTYTITYTLSTDSVTGNSSVDVSSSYCARGSSTGTSSSSAPPSTSGTPTTAAGEGSDPGSKYCVELGTAQGKYGTLDIAGFDDQGLPAVRNSLGRLQSLADDDQLASSWKTVLASYTSVDSILQRAGLQWSDLKTLESGQTPKGVDSKTADSIRADVQVPLTTKEFQASSDFIAGHAGAVCGISLG
jgi:prepilin-type N-terminal cleavage/methylation domain-containing protein